jgi:hypothetical protein
MNRKCDKCFHENECNSLLFPDCAWYPRKELKMNPYLKSFLKSVVLSGITVGASYVTGTPWVAIGIPFLAMLQKYITDNWQ